MTMVQGVLQRAVEWGRVPSNAVKLTRKPPKQYRPAVQAIPPSVIEVMRARLLADGRLRDATLLVVLAYAGLRPQEALALEWRHVRERTLLVERAVSDGQLKVLKNRRQPRTVSLLAPLREDLATWRRASRLVAADRAGVPLGVGRVLARDGLAQLAQADLQAGRRRRSGSTARARTTCGTRSRRC